MASVRKRITTSKGKPVERYVVDYFDAKGKRRLKTFDKQKEAKAHLDQVKRELFEGTHVAARDTMTFDKLAATYLDASEMRWRSGQAAGNTHDIAKRVISKHLVPHFLATPVDTIEAAHVQALVDKKIAEGYSKTMLAKIKVYSTMILQLGVERGHLRRDVLRDIDVRLPRGRRDQIEIPSLAGL